MKSGLPFPFLGHRWWFIGFLALIWSSILHAQVTLDGTLGPAGSLSGPHYAISADLSRQIGGNLFHSFGQFSIHAGESATFSGPNSVNNIIGRVTGGQTSFIDGTMRSTIPGASLYLLNPAGILFGENAALDVQGSFHASTADYLRLRDGGRFDARAPGDSVLTVAPVSAFGFLSDAPASIKIQGGRLEAPTGEAISFLGGQIEIEGRGTGFSNLIVPSGRIQLVSVASPGQIELDHSGMPTDASLLSFSQLGAIHVSNNEYFPNLTTTGDAGGTVFIRGGQLFIEGGIIQSNSTGATSHSGIGVDIAVTGDIFLIGTETPSGIDSSSLGAGDAGDIRIMADHLLLRGGNSTGSSIGSRAWGSGRSGTIKITTNRLWIEGRGGIEAAALKSGSGSAGDIFIKTNDLQVLGTQGPTGISTLTESSGDAGNLYLTADHVLLRSERGDAFLTTQASSLAQGQAKAGNIQLTASNVQVLDGAQISAAVFSGSGNAGNIEVQADSIFIAGTRDGFSAGIFTDSRYIQSTQEPTQGNAGRIIITARDLRLTNRGQIAGFSDSFGNSGDIDLQVDRLEITNGAYVSTLNFGAGRTGSIHIDARQIELAGPSPQSGFTGIFARGGLRAAGAGDVVIETDSLWILNGAEISSATFGPSPGGAIEVTARSIFVAGFDDANARPARIDASTTIFNDFTEYATGDSGDIRIQTDILELQDRGQILTVSNSAGDGGSLQVQAGRIELNGRAAIGASSTRTGNAGNITLITPTLTLSESSFITAGSLQTTGGNIDIEAAHLKLFEGSVISSSVAGNELSDGGNVTLNSTNIVALNDSKITAFANEGRGGNIVVNADVFLHDAANVDQVLDASSRIEGNDGTVRNNAPTTDISGSLVVLKTNYLDAAGQLSPRCGVGDLEERSRFMIQGRGAFPIGPDDPGMVPASRCGPETLALTSTVTTEGLRNDLLPTPPAEPPISTTFGFNNR